MNLSKNKASKFAYQPNKVLLFERVTNLLLALALIIYGGYGIYVNKIVIPAGRGKVIAVLHDGSVLLMTGAFICGSLVLLSVIFDHYDARNNEVSYKKFKWFCVRLGWCLFASSLLSHLFLSFTK